MVMAAVCADEKALTVFQKEGVRDSKKLTRSRREVLYLEIKKLAFRVEIVVRTARQLNKLMKHQTLNEIELNCLKELLSQFSTISIPLRVVVDQFDVRKPLIAGILQETLRTAREVTIAFRADESYVVCAAASIIAKCERDWAMDEIAEELGEDFFSGYPADPKTQHFLQRHVSEVLTGHWPYVRYEWKTIKRMTDQKTKKGSLKDFVGHGEE